MAKRPKNEGTPVPEATIARDPLDTALLMIETSGWRAFTLPELARELDVPLSEVYARFGCRTAVLNALGKRLDAKMLSFNASEFDDLSTRDRLFELLMRRFDAMRPYKAVLENLSRDARGDLEAAGVGFGNLSRAVVELVDAAGIRGGAALLARHAVGLLYLRVLRVWMKDEDPEQAKTLAELDKGLARMEMTAQRLSRFMPKRRAAEAEPAAA